METTNQIKIEALECELEKRMADIDKYHNDIRKLMSEIVKYESGRTTRADEMTESEKNLEIFKNSIPDFSEEKCEMYLKYLGMKESHERLIKFYGEIEDRIKKLKEDVCSHESYIKEANQRIEYLKEALAKAVSEEIKED